MDFFEEELNRLRRAMERVWKMREMQMPEFKEPLSDVFETENEVIVSIEMPGIDKKDIILNITENSLEAKAEKKKEEKIEKKGYYKAERTYKGFYRMITLPSKVVPEKAKASYKNGVLTVTLPKAEKKKTKAVTVPVD